MLQFHCRNCNFAVEATTLVCPNCGQLQRSAAPLRVASYGKRVGAFFLEFVLLIVTLFIGYFIWWLFALRRGQTPGKQVLGIRAVRTDGTELGWGMTFVREFLVKGLLGGIAQSASFGVSWLLDSLWPLWDKDKQTVHDKIVSTLVVEQGPTVVQVLPPTPVQPRTPAGEVSRH